MTESRISSSSDMPSRGQSLEQKSGLSASRDWPLTQRWGLTCGCGSPWKGQGGDGQAWRGKQAGSWSMMPAGGRGRGSGTKVKAEPPRTERELWLRNIPQGEGGFTGTTKMSSRLFGGNQNGNGLKVNQPRVALL